MGFSERQLRSILHQGTPRAKAREAARRSGRKLARVIEDWGEDTIVDVVEHGSFAKETNIVGGADIDLFVSITSTMAGTLQEMRESLFKWLRHEKRYIVRRQDVSIRTRFGNIEIDVVPGKRQTQWGGDHSLWSRELGSYIKTNINKQIRYVVDSGRQDEIRLAKLWRDGHGLECPSFLLELAVIRALKGKRRDRLDDNFETVLEYLAGRFRRARLTDPGNSANVVSSVLDEGEKDVIADAAANALGSSTRRAFGR